MSEAQLSANSLKGTSLGFSPPQQFPISPTEMTSKNVSSEGKIDSNMLYTVHSVQDREIS